jgi:hypothetical protein
LWIINNQQDIDNFYQDFVASTKSGFFQGMTDKGLFHILNHARDAQLLKRGEKEEEEVQVGLYCHFANGVVLSLSFSKKVCQSM